MSDLDAYFNVLRTYKPGAASAGALDLPHNVFLIGAVLARKPHHVLELGVGSGFVTVSLLHALRHNGRGALTCVDNWSAWGGAEPAGVQNFRAAGVNVVTMDEAHFVHDARTDAFDMLISDADRSRGHEWLDDHLRIVQSDGFLFFRDTNQPAIFPGLATIENRIRERGLPHFHFKESTRPDERCERGWLFVINRKTRPAAPAPAPAPAVAEPTAASATPGTGPTPTQTPAPAPAP
jgi:predicted O-methyltransferase YrrM